MLRIINFAHRCARLLKCKQSDRIVKTYKTHQTHHSASSDSLLKSRCFHYYLMCDTRVRMRERGPGRGAQPGQESSCGPFSPNLYLFVWLVANNAIFSDCRRTLLGGDGYCFTGLQLHTAWLGRWSAGVRRHRRRRRHAF